MKKLTTLIAAILLTFTLNASIKGKTIEVPETFDEAFKKIAHYEKNNEYYYKFTAINFGDATCEVKIYDQNYMLVYQPETKQGHYYYFIFNGDYINSKLNNKRSGIFGYAVDLITNEVFEIVFCNKFTGGYKFKGINDDIQHDKSYSNGFITWNTFPDRKIPEPMYFLDFFEKKDKKMNDNHDEHGNYRDLAGQVYWAKTQAFGYKPTFKKE